LPFLRRRWKYTFDVFFMENWKRKRISDSNILGFLVPPSIYSNVTIFLTFTSSSSMFYIYVISLWYITRKIRKNSFPFEKVFTLPTDQKQKLKRLGKDHNVEKFRIPLGRSIAHILSLFSLILLLYVTFDSFTLWFFTF